MDGRTTRVALYSPGMVGLGHLRRNLLLARRFAADHPGAAVLLLTEAREAGIFTVPDSVDCLSLPAIRKSAEGGCSPRRLAVGLPELVRLRSAVLDSALAHFAPDVLVVDHLPRGALGELAPALERLRRGGSTRLVLGLRDILEEPATVRREWASPEQLRTIEELYDTVWIYGSPEVFDAVREYDLPETIARRARFIGYLNPLPPAAAHEPTDADGLAARLVRDERVILCQVGGGQDGLRLARAFARAELPRDAVGVLLCGPFMPRADRVSLAEIARRRGSRMHVLSLIAEPLELLGQADRVVTMGGYNSTCEVIALGKRALVVPRTHPRREQLMRASRLSALGFFDMLHPRSLTPAALSEWMARPAPRAAAVPPLLDMGGLDRAAAHLRELVAAGAPSAPKTGDTGYIPLAASA